MVSLPRNTVAPIWARAKRDTFLPSLTRSVWLGIFSREALATALKSRAIARGMGGTSVRMLPPCGVFPSGVYEILLT